MALLIASGLSVAHAQSYSSGLIPERAGQVEQAFEEYRLALDKNPQDLPAYNGLVRLAEPLSRYDTLVAVSRRLVKLQPDRSEYSFGLIDGLLATKRVADARAEARRAAGKWPDRLTRIGDAFARHEDYALAIEYYEQARGRDRNPLLFSDRLVELHEAAGQPLRATREMVQAVNVLPQSLDRFRQKLAALAARGGKGLIGELDKIENPAVRARAQAVVHLATKKEAEAVRVLTAVLSEQELYQFAHDCEAQGALRAALAVYQKQKAHVDAARVLRRMGRRSEALAELALDSGMGAQVELADLYREQREFQRAAEVYRRVLTRQPKHEPAAFGLASSLLGLGRTSAARAAAESIGRLTDRLLLLVSRTFFYEGEFDSAGAYVAELAKRFPQSRLVNDGLELAVLTGSGERAKALARLMLDYETGAGSSNKAQALCEGDDPVAEQASFLLARFLRREKRPKDALAALEAYRQRFAGSSLTPRARLEQASVYREDLKDEAKYRETLEELIVEHPGSAYVPIARSLLAEAGKPVAPEGIR